MNSFANPSNESSYYGLRPFPGFNMQTRPYLLVKDRQTLSVVNVSSMRAMVVVDQCPFKWDSFRDYTVDVSMSDDGK